MSDHPVCRLLIGHDEGVVCPVLLFRTGPRRWMSSDSTGHSASSGAGSSATAPPSSGGAAPRRGAGRMRSRVSANRTSELASCGSSRSQKTPRYRRCRDTPQARLRAEAGRHNERVVDAEVERERGRESYARREWSEAYEALSSADRAPRLEAGDLELLATSAWMLGREDEYLDALERGYQAHLDAGESERAVRCAFWLGVNLARRGEMGRAGGRMAGPRAARARAARARLRRARLPADPGDVSAGGRR